MNIPSIRKVALILILLFSTITSFAQYAVVVDVSSLYDRQIKEKVDENVTKLLSEINRAFTDNSVPKLTGIDMSDEKLNFTMTF